MSNKFIKDILQLAAIISLFSSAVFVTAKYVTGNGDLWVWWSRWISALILLGISALIKTEK